MTNDKSQTQDSSSEDSSSEASSGKGSPREGSSGDDSSPGLISRRRIPLTVGAVLIGAAIGFAAIYGSGVLKGGARGDPACRGAAKIAKRIGPLAHGEVAALTMASAPLRLPDLAFEDANGKPTKLSNWRGKTVLVNLWATWCVPCRKEMPTLDRLQGKLAGPNFDVVAINIDSRDPQKSRDFMEKENLHRLGFYSDQNGKVFQDLKSIGPALGLPTSVLVDPHGCEIASIAGPAKWDSDDAIKLITAAITPAGTGS